MGEPYKAVLPSFSAALIISLEITKIDFFFGLIESCIWTKSGVRYYKKIYGMKIF